MDWLSESSTLPPQPLIGDRRPGRTLGLGATRHPTGSASTAAYGAAMEARRAVKRAQQPSASPVPARSRDGPPLVQCKVALPPQGAAHAPISPGCNEAAAAPGAWPRQCPGRGQIRPCRAPLPCPCDAGALAYLTPADRRQGSLAQQRCKYRMNESGRGEVACSLHVFKSNFSADGFYKIVSVL